MLPKVYRLTKSNAIKKVMREGRRASSRFFSLKSLPSFDPKPRFTIITDLRVSKKSIIRNRLKRQASEIIRSAIGDIFGGHDIVIWIKPEAVGKEYEEIEKDMLWVLKKSNLIR